MKEIREILRAWERIKGTGVKAALATVVKVEGSSYRRPGARMLVMDDGTWVGGISGGCLEGDALKKARISILNERASLVRYDTTDNDPYQIGVGLGCQGIIDVLIQPLTPTNYYLIDSLKTISDKDRRKPVHMLTVLNNNIGDLKLEIGLSILFNEPPELALANRSIRDQIIKILAEKPEMPSFPITIETVSGKLHLSYERISPEIHLVLAGSQYDLVSVVKYGELLDWKISIVGNLTKIGQVLSKLSPQHSIHSEINSVSFDSKTAIILMAHDYKTDFNNLSFALQTDAGFLGILGPRKRSDKMFAELKSQGIELESAKAKNIHAPIGLDIGAANPEEIALSVVSGLLASFNHRSAGYLKDRKLSIHAIV